MMRFYTTVVGVFSVILSVVAFSNPILWEDLADVEIRRVGNVYYYSASTMHYSPGAPILRSYDLFNWEYIGHSVPSLDFGSAYNLESGTRAYVRGIWASFFGYNSHKKRWYWGGCVGFQKTYIYSSPTVTGPWTQLTVLDKCYYDCGLLVDDDGTMYVSYIVTSNSTIWIAQLSSDGKSEVKSEQVYAPPSEIGYLEGSRMYKRNGLYYILLDKPATAEYTLKASSPFGPYTMKNLVDGLAAPGGTNGGNPHQGGFVDTPSGQWYYMAFTDVYPGGRIPVLAPITWGSDGFPVVTLVNGTWGDSYPNPAPAHPVGSLTGVDYFVGSSLGPQWEWNHNPDSSKFSVGRGLVLNTATVTIDLYQARNTLSHRILGPISTATIKLNYKSMKDGDRAGLAMLRDQSAWVGVRRDRGAYTVAMVSDLAMDLNWNTTSIGNAVGNATISGGTIWLRVTADIRPSGTKVANFSYSSDGRTFKTIGTPLVMNDTWQFFMGYRFGIFNYATMRLYVTLAGALSAILSVVAFSNPVIWEDLADLDIRRVDNVYYYSASTMHYSPGAPILRSYDLFNWEYIGHSVPTLDFGSSSYDLASGTRAYVKGIWASFFGYNSPKKTWYWGGCIGFGKTYIYSSSAVTGPWTQLTVLNKCYYDCGMLVDDDGTMYVSYIYNNNIWVAQLSSDGKSEVKSQQVYAPPTSIGYLEGSRMYKRSGVYYILLTKPASAEYTLKASSPFGSYSIKNLVDSLAAPGGTNGGNPHQGGLVDTPSGQWYYMAFIDAYPGGRIPVLAPVTWGSDGFPAVTLVNGKWGDSYTDPATAHPVSSLTGVDYFTGSSLGPQWEWNHNPDTSKFSLGSGLVLNTATVTTDLYQARNTLSHRILGPISTATIKLSYGSMKDGDRTGLAMLRDSSAWVGVRRDGGAYTVAMVSGLTMDSSWNTVSTGNTVASSSISGGTIWLRATADIQPSGTKTASFSYSTDGSSFKAIGTSFTLNNAWQFFMGYRFGIFNYATSALGGKVTVANFQLDSGSGSPPAGGRGTTTTTSTPPSTTTPSGCTVALYGQCGGQGYTGCTTCASGSKCTVANEFYSQCL